MDTTHELSTQPNSAGSRETPQYSLARILGIWASVTAPMALLAFVVAPMLIARTSMLPGLVLWLLLVAGMGWQFVVSSVALHRELGGLRWPDVSARLRLTRPIDPRTKRPRKMLWWWALPAIGANVLGGYLAISLDAAWVGWLPGLAEPDWVRIENLATPELQGQWWVLVLALVSCLFNYLLGEELLFRGVLLPRMAGVFGRWDWVANTVLFGLYHVHKIWFWPSMILSSFGMAWAARRYRSMWMGVVVHGVEAYFVVLVFAVVLGLYP